MIKVINMDMNLKKERWNELSN